jgi:hypothetical protein
MSDRERLAVLALGTLLVLLAPGYLVHVSPRFPGSLTGSLFGIAAAFLMVALLAYPAIKHVSWLRERVTRRVSLGRLLSLHIYAGLLAALLAIVHSGHKYQSVLGMMLMVDVMIVIATGFIGRFYVGAIGADIRQQQMLLGTLRASYDRMALRLAGRANAGKSRQNVPMLDLVDAIADLEYGITGGDAMRRIASRWTVVHVTASVALYGLLALHVLSGVYYGLRWLR